MELALPKKMFVTKHQYRNVRLKKVPLRHRLRSTHNKVPIQALEDPDKTTEERNVSATSFIRRDLTYGPKHCDTRNKKQSFTINTKYERSRKYSIPYRRSKFQLQ